MPMSKYPNLEIAEEEVPPETPNQEDIFKLAPNDNFEEVEDDAPKTKKPKRKMSQKQLDHLTKIRTKAQATRIAKAKAKKELKEKGMEEEEVGDTGLSKKEEEEKYEKDTEPKINTPSRGLTAAEIRKIAREEAKAEKEDRKRIKQKEKAKKDDIEKARQEGIAMGRQQITDSIGQYVGNRKTPKPVSKQVSVPKPKATFGNPKLDALLNY